MQTFVVGATEIDVAFVGEIERFQQELRAAALSLFCVTFLQLVADFHQVDDTHILAEKQVTQMTCHALDEVLCVEALVNHLVNEQKY